MHWHLIFAIKIYLVILLEEYSLTATCSPLSSNWQHRKMWENRLDIIYAFSYPYCENSLSLFFLDNCLAPYKVGRCRGSFPRWYYNPEIEQCQQFIFGGCNPNKNNYVRKEECDLACKNVQGSYIRRYCFTILEI